MPQQIAYTLCIIQDLRRKRADLGVGEGPETVTCYDKNNNNSVVKVRNSNQYQKVPRPFFGLIYHGHKDGITLHVLAFADPRSYKILTTEGLKYLTAGEGGRPFYDRKKIQTHLATRFHCHLSKMLRNINWHAAETLLETPGSFELMAYLDGNLTAIGKKSARNLNTDQLDTQLYNVMDEFKAEVVPQITCIAEELQGLKEELGTKADKSDVESLEKTMEAKLSLKADKSDMKQWNYNLNLLANSTEGKLQFKADREELEGKADREELEDKADRAYVDRKLAEIKAELEAKMNAPSSSLRGEPRHVGLRHVGFNDVTNRNKAIGNKAESRRPTNATNCVAISVQSKQIYLGILPLFSSSRVAIIHPQAASTTMHVSGNVTTLHVGKSLLQESGRWYPDIVLVDWGIVNGTLTAKIVVDLRSLQLMDPLPHSGELPPSVYWGLSSVNPNAAPQNFVFGWESKCFDAGEQYGEGKVSHGSVVRIDAKQKRGSSGVPSQALLKALLLGPPA